MARYKLTIHELDKEERSWFIFKSKDELIDFLIERVAYMTSIEHVEWRKI